MKTINVTLTEQQLNTIAKALGQLPYAEVFNLISEISKQVKANESTEKNI
jgi:hypothetical protein